jgi:CRISPR/Cas system CSM-associated protein Csm3 (group 7 of RAMP superfamily)
MTAYCLEIELLSDTTFGRGDGVAGLVDVEVQHDPVGLPYLDGRTLKGLLVAESDDIVYALERSSADKGERWRAAHERLFGRAGETGNDNGLLHVGAARLPQDLHDALAHEVEDPHNPLSRAGVLDTLTSLRRQTAMDETGAPRRETLRTMRVILRGLTFQAPLLFRAAPGEDALALLAATVKAFRRAGTGRNRGRGRVRAALYDGDGVEITAREFERFCQEVSP